MNLPHMREEMWDTRKLLSSVSELIGFLIATRFPFITPEKTYTINKKLLNMGTAAIAICFSHEKGSIHSPLLSGGLFMQM